MHSIASRAGRWPLALTLAVVAACSDEPSAPTLSAPLRPNAAAGDVFLVTNTNDSGLGSLRWALGFTTGGEVIRFDPALAGQTIALDSTIYIYESVMIEGLADAGITIDGRGHGRVIMARFAHVTLRNLSITGGNADNLVGGAFYGEGDLVLENSLVYNNRAGSAVAIAAGNVTITNSTITGTKLARPTTFDYPVALADTVVVTNSTIVHNEWGGIGSAIAGGRVVLRNSIVSNNGGKNCPYYLTPVLVREGTNISDDDTCGGPSEIIIADPKLGALADNGGPTKTHALLAGSPAINAGSNCSVQADQRYFPRDAQCDLGAFEFADFTTVTITIDPASAVSQNGWATLTGTVTCSRSETFSLALELHQEQRVGKETVDIHSAATEPVACGPTAGPWSASMVLTEGAFQNGTAAATAVTFDAEPWVASASASRDVKLYRSRK